MSREGPGPSSRSRFDDFPAAGEAGNAGFFKGAEFSKLLALLAIMVVGWALVWKYIHLAEAPIAEAGPVAPAAPPSIEADKAIELESVTDWTPIGLRDMAAYDLLLKRARAISAADLAGQGRRDILYTDLWERPARLRGVAIHLLGNARRVHSYESKKSPRGRIYEAWINTGESQGNPYVCVFEDLPEGMPVGPDVSERVVFNGYFLKNMRYLAGKDVVRGAPVLIGKIGWTAGVPTAHRDNSVFWMTSILGIMFVVSLFRWTNGLRRSLAPRPRPGPVIGRPTDEIASDDLARWVDSVQEDEREPGELPETENPRH